MFYVVDNQQKISLMAFSKNLELAQQIADQLNAYLEKSFLTGQLVVISNDEMRAHLTHDLDNESALKIFEVIESGEIDLDWSLSRFAYEQSVLDINQARELDDDDDLIILFESDSTAINNPYLSECGRFSASPILTYGVHYIKAFNQYPDDCSKLPIEHKVAVAHVLAQQAINEGKLKPLKGGAPEIDEESFFSISAEFSNGTEQDRIVSSLCQSLPDFS